MTQELLNVIDVIYSQYWLAPKVKLTFHKHMAIIQTHFGHHKALRNPNTIVGPLLNLIIFLKFFFFKWTMQNHYQGTMATPHDCNQLCDYGKILEGGITIKGITSTKVKVFFQGLQMTCVIYALVYNLKFCISNTPFNVSF